MTIWHIEVISQGDRENAMHGYYTSRKGLYIDNKEEIPVSEYTLDRHDWSKPYDSGEGMIRVVIRKGRASNTKEVERYNKALEEEDFDITE